MNKKRVFLAAIASLGLGAAAACGSSSSGDNGNGNGGNSDGGGGGSTTTDGGDGGAGNPFGTLFGDGGPTKCSAGQMLCLGVLGNTCVDADAGCGFGTTTVFANECASNSDCQGGNVCCSSFADSMGNPVLYDDAGGLATMYAGVTVQCLPQCPTNAASSEVCDLDDAGATTTNCPSGTSCRDYSPIPTRGLPNSLCLPPLPDASFTRPQRDSGTETGEDSGSTTPPATDASPE
jgi:hypothetical protein